MFNSTIYLYVLIDKVIKKPSVSFQGPNITLNPNPHPRLSKFNCFNSRHMMLAVMKTSVRLIYFRKTNSQKRDIMSYFGEFSVVTDSSFKEYKGGVLRQTFVSFALNTVLFVILAYRQTCIKQSPLWNG